MKAFIDVSATRPSMVVCMVVGLTHRAPSERAPALADWDVLSYRIIHCDRVCTSFEITDSRFRIYVGSCVKPIPTRENRDIFRDSTQCPIRLVKMGNFKVRYSSRSIDRYLGLKKYKSYTEIMNSRFFPIYRMGSCL